MHNFNFDFDLLKAEGTEDGRLFITGCASDTSLDQQRDRMTINALHSMAKSALGAPIVTSHTAELADVIGNVIDAHVDGTTFIIKAELDKDDSRAVALYKKIEKGQKAGFSPGGSAKAHQSMTAGERNTIIDVAVDHIALTRKPANKNTFAMAIAKTLSDLGEPTMEIENTTVVAVDEPTTTAVDAVVEVVAKTEATPEVTAVTVAEVDVEKAGAKLSADTIGVIRDAISAGDMNALRRLIGDPEAEDDNDGDNDNGAPIGVIGKTVEVESKSTQVVLSADQLAEITAQVAKSVLIEVSKTHKVDTKSVPVAKAVEPFTMAKATSEQVETLWKRAIGLNS